MNDRDLFRADAEADLDFLPTDWAGAMQDQRDNRAARLRAERAASSGSARTDRGSRNPSDSTPAS